MSDWFENVSWLLATAAAAAVLLKLGKEHLLQRYVYFSAYMASHLVSSAVLGMLPRNRNSYYIAFFCFEALRWILAVLITLDIYKTVLKQYPGIAATGRRLITAALAAGLLIALASLAIFDVETPSLLLRLFVLNRLVTLGVFLFLALMSLFLLWFPIPLQRNVSDYAFGFSVYFLIKSVGMMVINLAGIGIAVQVSGFILVATALCCLYWTVRLNQAGEISPVKPALLWNSMQEQQLLRQLQDINLSLLRATRKI